MYKIGDNIISSLGFTTEENFSAVKQGISGVKHYDAGTFDLPEAFMASLIDKEKLNIEFSKISSKKDYTDLEKSSILSVFTANQEAKIDLTSDKTIFILSTTKGNVELLDMRYPICDMRQENDKSQIANRKSQIHLWHTAKIITNFFKNPNTPIVVSNACISGAAAQIAALRELKNGNFDYAIVVGVDFLSKFIISGFQSFKALSPELCRPFDKDRCGLNLGEAAATIIFSRVEMRHATSLLCGAICNDSNHISAPSRTGEGSYRALQYILSQISNLKSQISFINAHGTATPYNDAMEVNAIVRAGLEDIPVNSLKAFFGHTLGAAGVLESIISMRAMEENLVLKSLNFDEQNFDNQINISQKNHFSDKCYFVKMLSGFGGVNAALLFFCPQITQINTDKIISDSWTKKTICENPCNLWTKKTICENPCNLWTKKTICENPCNSWTEKTICENPCNLWTKKTICENPCNLWTKKEIHLSFKNTEEITDFYRSLQVDYPKFFKMDNLSKLGFLASEMIFKDDENRFSPREDVAVVCFNRSSSLDIDTQYQATIADNENYFPSPSLFVYTLPNIVTGEIAIRNKFFGETSFYICENFDAEQIFRTVSNVFSDNNINFVLAAWIECFENIFEVKMFLVTKEKTELEFLVKTLNTK